MEDRDRAWAEIDLAALVRNYRWLKGRAADRRMIAVVKANGYGHGAGPVAKALAGSAVALGAQNMYFEPKGAFTGEISAAMLKDVGCLYVILGHSERRQHFGDTDEAVNRKVKAALGAGLRPIICVGETLGEREAGRTFTVVETQVRGGLTGISSSEWERLVIAYEPV